MFRRINILILLNIQFLFSQNLVPNPGFDDYVECPPYLGQIHLAKFWDSPNNTTTDYFHRCSPEEDGASVPNNQLGNQEPYQGNAYAGLRAWIPAGSQELVYREYLGTRLTEALKADFPYHVSFRISLAEASTHTTDDIGIYFSNIPFSNDRLYDFQAEIRNPEGSLILETDNWITISGTYIAKGGEEYVVIGNFQDDVEMTRVERNNSSGDSEMIYFYVDNIEVSECQTLPSPLTSGKDTSICKGMDLRISPGTFWESVAWEDGSTVTPLTVKEEGTYRFNAAYGGCKYQDSILVNLIDVPDLELKDTTICEGETLELEFPDTLKVKYNWSDGSYSNTFISNKAGIYEVDLAFNGCNNKQSFELKIDSIPNTLVLTLDTFFCSNQSLLLGPSNTSKNYIWENTSRQTPREINTPGTFTLTQLGQCYDTETIFSVSKSDCECQAFIPNVFTPNGDGINDEFKILSDQQLNNFHLQIFDRWGKQVFESNNSEHKWNGNYAGSKVINGVYYWVLSYECIGKEKSNISKGSVYLVN